MEFITQLSTQYKLKLDTLVPRTIKGTFEAHVTFDCTHDTEKIIERLKNACENTKYKIIFIDLNTNNAKAKLQQLMTSSYYCGEYPSIVKDIEEEVYKHFKDFNIIRLKIESLASNDGVPESNSDKLLFWDSKTNYFEFHYKVLVKDHSPTRHIGKLRKLCESNRKFHLHLSRNAFKHLDENNAQYMITMRLFDVGREKAFENNKEIIEYLTNNKFPPIKVVREFIVYDSYIELDNGWE